MSLIYSDIPLTELESVRPYINEKDEVRLNLAGDRCVIKWLNGHECIDELECVHRTHAEAQLFYNDPINGWCTEVIG